MKLRMWMYLAILAGISISFTNCAKYEAVSKKLQSVKNGIEEDNSSVVERELAEESSTEDRDEGNEKTPELISGEPSFGISSFEEMAMILGESRKVIGTLTSLNEFSGTVELAVDRSGLDQIDVEKNIQITINPNRVNLVSGRSAVFELSVVVDSMAPSLDLSKVKIVAKILSGETVSVSSDIGLKVDAVFEMKMFGANSNAALRWDRPNVPINIRDHRSGVSVRFVNYDTRAAHIVHGNGAIPHQLGQSTAATVAGEPGQAYEVNISAGTVRSGSFYYHDIENGGDARAINFGVSGVSAAKVVITTVGNRKPAASEQTAASCHDLLGTD